MCIEDFDYNYSYLVFGVNQFSPWRNYSIYTKFTNSTSKFYFLGKILEETFTQLYQDEENRIYFLLHEIFTNVFIIENIVGIVNLVNVCNMSNEILHENLNKFYITTVI